MFSRNDEFKLNKATKKIKELALNSSYADLLNMYEHLKLEEAHDPLLGDVLQAIIFYDNFNNPLESRHLCKKSAYKKFQIHKEAMKSSVNIILTKVNNLCVFCSKISC
jgi:hypothetical protein